MRPKWAGGPANRPDGPLQSLRRRVWAARVFALSVPDAFEKHFFNGLLEGKTIAGVAQKQARVYAEYSMPGLPLTLTSGVQYLGKRSVDEGNQWNVGSVTLLDLGARYVTRVNGRQVTVRLNVDNATNRAYWLTHTGWNALVQGAPRTVKLGAQIEF